MSIFDKMLSKTRSKGSYEAVAKVTAALDKLSDNSPEKLQEEISKTLSMIKVRLSLCLLPPSQQARAGVLTSFHHGWDNPSILETH